MKFTSSLPLMIILVFSFIKINAQELSLDEPKTYDVLYVSGQITHGEHTQEAVIVELFENNNVVDAFETKKNGKFKFTLMSGHIYTLQLTKEGYYTKRISVNTHVPNEVKDSYKFDFDINVDSLSEKIYDTYLVEYPSALIAYDAEKDEFLFDKNYTKSYFEEIEK